MLDLIIKNGKCYIDGMLTKTNLGIQNRKISIIGDLNLGWESSETINIGVDLGLWQGRVQGDINLYRTNTSDLLLNRTISAVHGILQITQNIGETQTHGVEVGLTATAVAAKNFRWTVNGNIAANKNKILSLYGELDEEGNEINDLANSWFVGEPIRVNYGYKMIGVWQLGEEDEASVYDREPGDAKIEDLNNDGMINDDDRQVIGQRDPKFTWGLSNSFSYKNFGLEIFMHGVHGTTKNNHLLQDNTAAEVRRNVLKKDWWTPENPTNKFYKINGAGTTIYENASFIRIKDISLSYNFPPQVLKNLKLQRLQLYTTGRNLFTMTEWTGNDPELELYGEHGVVPLQREFTIGVKVGF